jgi:hypothetical protein
MPWPPPDAGVRVIAAGRDREAQSAACAGAPGVTAETVDLTDEGSIALTPPAMRSRSMPCGTTLWPGYSRSGVPSRCTAILFGSNDNPGRQP